MKTRGLVGSSNPESFPRVIPVSFTITLDNKLRGFASRREDIDESCGKFRCKGDMMYHVVDVVGPLLRIYYIVGIICAC
jgi:hypothetical protein